MRVARPDSSRKSRRLVGFIAAILLWLFLLYGRFLFQITPESYQPLWRFMGPLVWTTEFLNPVFQSPFMTVLVYALGMGLIVWGVVRFWQHKVWGKLLVVCGLLGGLFPFVMPALYGEYQMPVAARQGYELTWVTEPGMSFGSTYKQAQLVHEAQCDYHLSGWATETTLAYTSACLPGMWLYDMQNGEKEWILSESETADFISTSVTRWNNSEYLPQPAALQESSAFPFLTLQRSTSPDRQWEAIVVRWFYGPSDVVLVERAR
jgi:hypothetical protein